MANGKVDFGGWIDRGFKLYWSNLGVLLPASLIALLLSGVTMGILAGPMVAGLVLIVLQLKDGSDKKPEIATLFEGFSYFGQSFLLFLVWGLITFAGMIILNVIVCVGQLIAIFGALALGALLMFAMFFIVDRKMAFWPASMESIDAVKKNFWPLLGYYIVSSLLGELGVFVFGIGVFLTVPLAICLYAVAYREYFAEGPSEPETVPTTPEPPSEPAAGQEQTGSGRGGAA